MADNDPITPKKFARLMKKIHDYQIREYLDNATEIDMVMRHINADNLLCEMLRELGYGEGVDIYHTINKYYSKGEMK